MDLSIIIPIYNEKKIIKKNVLKIYNFLSKKKIKFEIILSNDGSQDKSMLIIKQLSKKFSNIRCVSSQKNNGKGSALTKGLSKAKGSILVSTDIDLDIDYRQIFSFYKNFNNNDLLIGSRFIEKSNMKYPIFRFFLSRTYCFIAKKILNLKTCDLQSGMKAYRRTSFLKVKDYIHCKKWSWDTEIIFLFEKFKFKITEMPVNGKLSSSNSLNLFSDSLKMFFALFRIKSNYVKLISFKKQ